MEDKSQSIFLIIIGIATLLVSIVGATFAWFGVDEPINEGDKNKVVTKALLSEVIFENGNTIDTNTLLTQKTITKKFKISQTDRESTQLIKYYIKLNITNNTMFTEEIPDILLHTIKSSGNSNGGTLVNLDVSNVPKTSIIIGSGVLDGYETHEYEYTIQLNTANLIQLQGKQFEGYISVELIESELNE